MSKRCLTCNRWLLRHRGESNDNWGKRETCGGSCAQQLRQQRADERRAAPVPRVFPNGWPQITDPDQAGLSGQCFAPYELRFCPQPGRLPPQPATAVVRGSALDGND